MREQIIDDLARKKYIPHLERTDIASSEKTLPTSIITH